MKDLIATIVGVVVVALLLITFISGTGTGTVRGQTNRIGTSMVTQLQTITVP